MQPYSTKKLKEFIAYARAKVFPKFSDEAAQAVVDCYKTLRQQGRVNEVCGSIREGAVVAWCGSEVALGTRQL